jgi:hypothetical protein
VCRYPEAQEIEFLGRLGVEDIVNVMKRGRVGLMCFGHVERKSREDCVKMYRDLVVECARSKGREKTWQECLCTRGHETNRADKM